MPVKPAPKKEEPAKKEEAKPAAAAEQQQHRKFRKLRRNARKNTKRKKASVQCTKLKATKFPEHVQHASGVDQDTSRQITMTGTLAVTVALHATSRSKISSFKSSNSNYSFLIYHA